MHVPKDQGQGRWLGKRCQKFNDMSGRKGHQKKKKRSRACQKANWPRKGHTEKKGGVGSRKKRRIGISDHRSWDH